MKLRKSAALLLGAVMVARGLQHGGAVGQRGGRRRVARRRARRPQRDQDRGRHPRPGDRRLLGRRAQRRQGRGRRHGRDRQLQRPGRRERHGQRCRSSSTRRSPRSRAASSCRSPMPRRSRPSIKKAIEAGIPVVSMNSGSDVFRDLGIKAHVGQTEFQAGLGAGERFKAAGVKNPRLLQPGSRQPGPDPALQRLLHGLGIDGRRRQVLTGTDLRSGRDAGDDRGGHQGGPDDRRPPDPRPVRGRSGPQGPSPRPAARHSSRPST